MPHHSKQEKLEAFGRLLDVIDTLRQRCPWDSKQTPQSLRPNTIEEVMELAEAIMANDRATMKKELGDVLMHVLLYAKMGDEQGEFDIADVCNAISEKLIYRHPRIYGNGTAANQSWEVLKMHEQGGNKTVLGGVPRTLPALIKAERIQEKAAGVGFDWEKKEDVWAKVREELAEVEAEMRRGDPVNLEKEFGDAFFSLVNAARLYGVRPDNALERTNLKFMARFNHIEQRAREMGRPLNALTLQEMDALWDEAKRQHLGE